MAAPPLRLTIKPLMAGTACGVGVQVLGHVYHGRSLDAASAILLIVFGISFIVAALVCVYPVFLVFPRSRVPAVWLGTVWGAVLGMLLAGLLIFWERDFVVSMGASGAAAGLGYSLWARRFTLR